MTKKLPVLPSMQCDPGCGECCGHVVCTEHEFDTIIKYAADNSVTPINQGLTCPFYQNGQCSVHPVRPPLCRLFGHVENMTCSRGYNRNITGPLLRKWNALLPRPHSPIRFLHEAIPNFNIKSLTEP